MKNYEYIIASLPVLSQDWKANSRPVLEGVLPELREMCSAKDNELIDTLLEGFEADNLTQEFYDRVLSHSDRFIREYFSFDLHLRNAKVAYLNRALGRDPNTDVLVAPEGGFDEADTVEAILRGDDLIKRENGLDSLMWDKIDSLTIFNYFDIDAVLGFLAREHIVSRWMQLDEATGREMFRRLVDEIRGTFKGVEFNTDNN